MNNKWHFKKEFIILATILSISFTLCEEISQKAADDLMVQKLLEKMSEASMKKHADAIENSGPVKPNATTNGVPLGNKTIAPRQHSLSNRLFEGDIVLNLPQAELILDQIKGKKSNKEKLFIADPNKKWETLNIPFIFKHDDPKWQQNILSALKHIEENTCFRFTNAGSEDAVAGQDHLEYVTEGPQGKGCYTSVGRQGGAQQISLTPGVCDTMGVAAHETVHSLGVWHEQSRDDRDNFLRIIWSNIITSPHNMTHNFDMHSEGDKQGLPYDLGSLMHYASILFSKSKPATNTIETVDKLYQTTIGQDIGLSFRDAKMVNVRFCRQICAGRKLACANGGYTDPNNCAQCRCPEGYGGTLCKDVAISKDASCAGGELTAKAEPQDLLAQNLAAGNKCYWRIKPESSNQQVEITFKILIFSCYTHGESTELAPCGSAVEIKFKKDKVPTGPRLCCTKTMPSTPILSDVGTDVLMIYSIVPRDAGEPSLFSISYKTVEGAGVATNTTSATTPPS